MGRMISWLEGSEETALEAGGNGRFFPHSRHVRSVVPDSPGPVLRVYCGRCPVILWIIPFP